MEEASPGQVVPAARSAAPGREPDPDLMERRRCVRSIPCPDASEHTDDLTWFTWLRLMEKHDKPQAGAPRTRMPQRLSRFQALRA